MDPAYLEAKRTVDDRSISPRVWSSFAAALERHAAARPDRPVAMLDLGAGTGTMIDRLQESRILDRPAVASSGIAYLGCEIAVEPFRVLDRRCRGVRTGSSGPFRSAGAFHGDVRSLLESEPSAAAAGPPFDVVVAHAVLDLFAPAESIRLLRELLQPAGTVYASIVFDGETGWAPEIAGVDALVMARYHASMTRDGAAPWARHQLAACLAGGLNVVDVAASDWVVVAARGDEDDATLVRSILGFVDRAVRPRCDAALSEQDLDRWLATRTRQLEDRELVFVAHQLDLLLNRGVG